MAVPWTTGWVYIDAGVYVFSDYRVGKTDPTMPNLIHVNCVLRWCCLQFTPDDNGEQEGLNWVDWLDSDDTLAIAHQGASGSPSRVSQHLEQPHSRVSASFANFRASGLPLDASAATHACGSPRLPHRTVTTQLAVQLGPGPAHGASAPRDIDWQQRHLRTAAHDAPLAPIPHFQEVLQCTQSPRRRGRPEEQTHGGLESVLCTDSEGDEETAAETPTYVAKSQSISSKRSRQRKKVKVRSIVRYYNGYCSMGVCDSYTGG